MMPQPNEGLYIWHLPEGDLPILISDGGYHFIDSSPNDMADLADGTLTPLVALPDAVDAPQWEREFPPEWDRHPWANYACLIVAFGHFDGVTLRWEYYEQKPEWGEKSYNWVGGLHGFENPVTRAPLSLFFDTHTTLRQRPASGQEVGDGA